MPTPRSLLLVFHVTPPTNMSAARRAAGLTKYLARLGYRVTVLTSVTWGSGPVPGAARTLRTRDLLASPLNWRRAGMAALKGETETAAPAAPSRLASWLVPDLEIVGWTPFAAAAGRRVVRDGNLDCVITSSPPASGHLVGLALQRMGIPWVADFRDGWTFETLRPPWALRALDRLDRGLERLVATRADGLCAVTEPIASDLAARFDREVATITNGFDPEALATANGSSDGLLTPGRRTVVHTGTLSYSGRPLEPLLRALVTLQESAPDAAQRLEVVLAGPTTEAERAQVNQVGLTNTVRFTGPVSHPTAVALQRAADGLLVITGAGQTGVATGKLYEYLTARRPIIVLGEETAAARIVTDSGAGVAVSRDDPAAIAAALRRLVESPATLPAPADEAAARFTYSSLAQSMATVIETAIARRRGGLAMGDGIELAAI